MLPQIPQSVNRLLNNPQGQSSTYPFPENVAGRMPKALRQKIFNWMLQTYIWPQIMERRPYERTWDKLLDMARAAWKYSELHIDENTRQANIRARNVLDQRNKIIEGVPGMEPEDRRFGPGKIVEASDTVLFDAVDRLTNLNHFISFKEKFPVRYEKPKGLVLPEANEVYDPVSGLVNSANSWLDFNATNAEVYRKGWMTARHHYTYGVSFVESGYMQRAELVKRPINVGGTNQWQNQMELTDIGTTFEPISIRKIWLNYRISVYKMEHQPCPFYFDEMPRFALNANIYNPQTMPMGYVNLDILPKAAWLFGGPETESLQTAFKTIYPNAGINFQEIMPPEYNTELKWTLYPMLPLAVVPSGPQQSLGFAWQGDTGKDPELWMEGNEEVIPPPKDEQGQTVTPPMLPLKRYIMESFGSNLCLGQQEFIRIQENFYPHDQLPLYGSAHMPSVDDGAYSPAIGTILEGNYRMVCKALDQIELNKDLNNDPPTDIMVGSPSTTKKDINKPGSRNPVNGPNDIGRREPFDSNNTTLQYWQLTREQIQTSSKSTDAILGKAMGSRTSATEASNVYQTAMSGVTTDTNLFSHDIFGNFAERTWLYTGRWVDPDVLRLITGTYGFAILPEHLDIRFGLAWDCGSQFIESITRQNNIQYLLSACPPGDPTLNRAYLFRELLNEWKFKNVDKIVNDGGVEQQILEANEQAVQTYMGMNVVIDPDQNHPLAIKVKTSYLKDHDSFWNQQPQFAMNAPRLAQQIQQHQQWQQLIEMQQMQMQQAQMLLQDPTAAAPVAPPKNEGFASNAKAGNIPTTAGQQRQQTGQ
jgi:hypothetical protein